METNKKPKYKIPEYDPYTGEMNPYYIKSTKMKKEPKFKVGDKAHKPKGYKFPCTIIGVFENLNGDIRIVGEMDEYGLLHIFNEEQLEHYD
jgi:hypothetical protein